MRFDISLCILAFAFAAPSLAQAPATTAQGPEVTYESVFSTYKRYEEPELASWTELNEEVAKAGGHVGIFGGAGHAGHGAAAKPEALKKSSPEPTRSATEKPVNPHAGH